MLLAGFFFALMNVAVKFVSHLPTMEVILFRTAISLLASYIFLKKQQIPVFGNNKVLLSLRGIAGCLGLIGSFYTLQHIPLASAVTINYLSPFFTAILGIFIVGQKIRPIQYLFFALSFLGVFIIQGFDTRISLWDLAIGISAAFFSGLAYNIIGRSKQSEHPLVVIFYFPLITFPIALGMTYFNWVTPVGKDWWLLLAIGISSQIAQYYMTVAYQHANLAKVASVNYLGMVYALIFGFIFFDEYLNLFSYLGMGLVLMGVLLNLYHKPKRV